MKTTLSIFAVLMSLSLCGAPAKCVPFGPGEVAIGSEGPFAQAAELNRKYLMEELDPARFLAEFRHVAGLPRKADRYGGWEGNQGAGHSLGHYLSALSLLYARTGDRVVKRRVDYIVEELWECQLKFGNGYVMTVPQDAVWDKVKAGDFSTGEFDVCRWWRPVYTLSKVMAGLRDAHRAAGSEKALAVERALADWYIGVVGGLDDAKLQKLLVSEWGELNGVFADLAVDTKDRKYLDAARRLFFDRRVFEPLARGEDRLDGASARATTEKVAGLASVCALSKDRDEAKAVETFWKAVVGGRMYPTGAFSDNERFYPVRDADRHMTRESGETCTACAMIRLAGRMFAADPTSDKMDYVERTLVNSILSGMGRRQGEYSFYQSMLPVAEKAFSHGHHVWTCCVGSGIESPERFTEFAYFHGGSTLWVNLFVDSSVTWREKGVRLVQKTKFPENGSVEIHVSCSKPTRFVMKIRRPSWCSKPNLNVAGGATRTSVDANGYMTIDRTWGDGDVVRLDMPMKARAEKSADGKFVTYFKGPVVLVGITPPAFGKEDFAKSRWGDDPHRAPGGTPEPARAVLDFGKVPRPPKGMKFMPLWKVYEEHYTICSPVCLQSEYLKREADRRVAERALAERKASVVDQVVIGWWPDEEAHRWNGVHDTVGENRGRKFRHAPGENGRFMYELAVDAKAKQYVEASFWGGDNGRVFELCVDWKVIATIELRNERPGEIITKRFEIPRELTDGKERVMVCFRGKKGTTWVGAVFSLAIVK